MERTLNWRIQATDFPLQENKIALQPRGADEALLIYLPLMKPLDAWKKLVILRKRIAGLSASMLDRFVLRVRRMVRLRGTVNLLVTNSAEVRSLNRRFRGADKPTDVLSFPCDQTEVLPASKRVAGDVAISADIARENAKRVGHSLPDEVKILALHGILHLAGFDHENDHGEMARKEIQLRRRLKLEAGLIERTKTQARKHSVQNRRVSGSAPKRKTA
jgi:probable rRNA maturation factor